MASMDQKSQQQLRIVAPVARSVLSVPGSNPRMTEKAIASAADVAFIDLEDAVTPALKAESRGNIVRALRELDWGAKPPAYRINALDTPYFYRDLVEVVEGAGDRLAMVVVPKVESAADVAVVDRLLSGIEMNMGFEPGRIAIEAQIETASGLVHAEAIATASPRLDALIFGPGDFAASVGMPAASIGGMDEWDALYPGHRYHYAMARIVVAAHAARLHAIDGPVADFHDHDGYRRSSLIARSLGYDGKWCIHPSQIPIANAVFAPTSDEIAWARKVVDAYEEAEHVGLGAVAIDGRMIDMASIRMAQSTLELARRAGVA